MFKLAMIQMKVEAGKREANLARAEGHIADAALNGADVALLPEALDLGWTHPSARALAQPIPDGDTYSRLASAAQKNKIYVCAGIIERSGDVIYNAAVLIDPAGGLLLHHRKLNELDIAHDLYAQGGRLAVAHTPIGTLGLMICADAFAADFVISRSLGYMGSQVILSPSAWAVPPDYDPAVKPYAADWSKHYSAPARQFQMWIAGVSNVGVIPEGPWQGYHCIGASLLMGPDGKEALRAPGGVEAETILYADIEPVERPARGTSWVEIWKGD
jgi:predicted amidohydrolase